MKNVEWKDVIVLGLIWIVSAACAVILDVAVLLLVALVGTMFYSMFRWT